MRVLLLGSDTPLGLALTTRHNVLCRHELVPLSRAACRWKSERQAKKSVVRAQCDIVVDLRIEATGDGSVRIHEMDLKRGRWVAKACQRGAIPHLYLSSSRVFSGRLDRPYDETDPPDNEEPVGQLLVAAETAISQACERHLILRVGPVFSHRGNNLISQMLAPLRAGDSLILDDNLRGCPVAVDDAARVILALVDQLSTGIEPWGIYHYGSADSATYYEVAEALLASASQFVDFSLSATQLEREPEGLPSLNRTLDCEKLLATFAIRQVSWRSAIGEMVEEYFGGQQQVEEE